MANDIWVRKASEVATEVKDRADYLGSYEERQIEAGLCDAQLALNYAYAADPTASVLLLIGDVEIPEGLVPFKNV